MGAEDKTFTTEPVETVLAAAIDDIRLSYKKKVTMSSAMAMEVGKRMLFRRTKVKDGSRARPCSLYAPFKAAMFSFLNEKSNS